MRLDLNIFRAVAVVLVLNSHLDKFYPDARFGFGGAFGNALFFFQAGYVLMASRINNNFSEGFFRFYYRRLFRLLPSVILVTIFYFVWIGEYPSNRLDYFYYLVWPTQYWFIGALIVFFVPYYFLSALGVRAMCFAMVFLIVVFFWFYFDLVLSAFSIESGFFRWIHYFQIMLLGGIAYVTQFRLSLMKSVSVLVFSFIGYLFVKLMLFKSISGDFQFTLIPLLMVFCVGAMSLFTNPLVVEWFVKSKSIYSVMVFLAGLTLEFYLVQVPVTRLMENYYLPFPFGLVAVVAIVCVGAYFLNRIVNFIMYIPKLLVRFL